MADAAVRFMAKVRLNDECWEWVGCKDPSGYGRFDLGSEQYAHRAAHVLFIGPIPDGLVIDHYRHPSGCIGPSCVAPHHIRAVTQRENILRSSGMSAKAAAAAECPSGHPYAGANLYIDPKGNRRCRICNRERQRRLRGSQAA